jgi:hypothetical protein
MNDGQLRDLDVALVCFLTLVALIACIRPWVKIKRNAIAFYDKVKH